MKSGILAIYVDGGLVVDSTKIDKDPIAGGPVRGNIKGGSVPTVDVVDTHYTWQYYEYIIISKV
jgi:hypothetical protein